uniref:Putative secreted protein n=1 Tax=Xenopsylla cheopis TaxID=163159 RepID=A0A6M2DZ79_XENCH
MSCVLVCWVVMDHVIYLLLPMCSLSAARGGHTTAPLFLWCTTPGLVELWSVATKPSLVFLQTGVGHPF